jgi:oxygen-independent coproporphyrinogen-3 oxidase
VPAKLFAARTGVPIEAIADELAQARERGLLEMAGGQLRPTLQGRRFLNELLQVFLKV